MCRHPSQPVHNNRVYFVLGGKKNKKKLYVEVLQLQNAIVMQTHEVNCLTLSQCHSPTLLDSQNKFLITCLPETNIVTHTRV